MDTTGLEPTDSTRHRTLLLSGPVAAVSIHFIHYRVDDLQLGKLLEGWTLVHYRVAQPTDASEGWGEH